MNILCIVGLHKAAQRKIVGNDEAHTLCTRCGKLLVRSIRTRLYHGKLADGTEYWASKWERLQ